MKIHKHLDLSCDYKSKVPATLQSLIVLYMDVFTQILNMSTLTKQTPFSIKGKEKEKEKDPPPTLANIEWMVLVAWQQHQSGKKKQHDHAHKISAVKHKPADP